MIFISTLILISGSYIAVTTNVIGVVLIVFGVIIFLNEVNDLKILKMPPFFVKNTTITYWKNI